MEKKELPASIIEITGGITAAAGFKATGIQAGIKLTGKPDLALLFSEKPCVAAGTFTRNAIRASSVDWCEKLLLLGSAVISTVAVPMPARREGADRYRVMAKLVPVMFGCKKRAVLVHPPGYRKLFPWKKSNHLPSFKETLF